jgi:uncharacterized protein YbjT (DUF2867 family)
MNSKRVTIIGATGNLGVPVTRNLIRFGFEVKVVAKSISKAHKYFGEEKLAQIVPGNLEDVSSLREALGDTEFLYLNLSAQTTDINTPFATEREGMRNIIAAVNRDRKKQILILSGLGAFSKEMLNDPKGFVPNRIRGQGHEILRKSGIPYTIMHCSWFTDSFMLFRRKGTYAVIGNTSDPIYFINAYDYSRQLANAIGNPKALNKDYPIQGKEGKPHQVAAREFFAELGDNTRVQVTPTWLLGVVAAFKKELKPIHHMAKYFDRYAEKYQALECNTYNDLGEPTLSIREYAAMLKENKFYNYLDC